MDDNTTTTPTNTDDAALEASLRAEAQAYDSGTTVETTPPAADAPATPVPEKTQSGNAPAATPTTTPTQPPPAQTPPQQQQQQTAYQQKRTDQQRNAEAWKKLEAEKAKFREDREKFYRDQAERARQPQTAPTAPTGAQSGDPLANYTPEQLERHAEEFDRAGKFDLAAAAREAAKAKREAPPPAAPQQAAAPQPQSAAYQAAHAEWMANLAAAEKQVPELADETSAFYKETQAALNQVPMLKRYPGGITHAVELVKLQREARAAGELRKQVADLNTRLQQAEARLVPAMGGPESGRAPRGIAEMSDADAEAEIRRQIAQAEAA